MSRSLLNPKACGFVKTFLFTMSDEHVEITLEELGKHFTGMEISSNEITRRTKGIKTLILKLGKTSPMKKASYLHWFSLHEWLKLSDKEKKAHSPFYCYGCTKTHNEYLTLLPTSRQLMKTCENHQIILPKIKTHTSRTKSIALNKAKSKIIVQKERKKSSQFVKSVETHLSETAVKR